MKKILNTLSNILNTILGNKYIVIAIIVGLVLLYLPTYSCGQSDADQKLETYNRQLNGDLSSAERTLQSLNKELGLSESKLVTQEELNEILKNENTEKDEKFDSFVKEHALEIKSMDLSIARLKQKIKNGITITTVDPSCNIDGLEGCIISYEWRDPYNRFKLQDPNIFEKDNEVFDSSQMFRIRGEIWEQKEGSLQTRRLSLVEVYKDTDGIYRDIPEAKAKILESEFSYHNPPTIDIEESWTDLFRLRSVVLINTELYPEAGDLRLGLGLSFFQYNGFSINTHTSLDFDDPKNIAQYIGVAYFPDFWDMDWNFALSVSLGSPFYNFGQEFSVTTGILFYLNR